MLSVTTTLAGVAPIIPSPTVVLSQNNTVADASVITTQEDKLTDQRATKIDTLLAEYNSPLVGYGKKFVTEANKNGIDWRLLVAISGRESTFALHPCKNATNSFLGYGSCKINFKSVDDAIEKVSASLGGNNENTARHYDGKTTPEILRKYNSIIPGYSKQVIKIMKMIDDQEEIV